MTDTALLVIASGLGGITLALIGTWLAVGRSTVTRSEFHDTVQLVRQLQLDQQKTTILLDRLIRDFQEHECAETNKPNA